MFDILPIPALVLVLLAAGLVLPWKLPRVSVCIAALALIAGILMLVDKSDAPYTGPLLDEIGRAAGIYTLAYATLWIAIAGVRLWTGRAIVPTEP